MGTLQLNILGTSFAIQAKEDSVYLQTLLDYYEDMVDQVSDTAKLKDSLKTAILAGIMITDELMKERKKNQNNLIKENQKELFEAEKLTLKMIETIDKVLK
jgi:cell division protein ZapA